MYFDAAATTPIDPRVQKAMQKAEVFWGNENSKHAYGFKAQKEIIKHIKIIAEVLNCKPAQIAVTYSGTDSNRRAIWSAQKKLGSQNCFCSAVEHSSILDEIDPSQRFDPETFESLNPEAKIAQNAFLALMAANSETGRLYDAEKLRKQFPEALILRDYAQSFAKGETPDLQNTDLGSFSPQKIYGPKMVGLLYMKNPEYFPEISKDSHTKSVPLIAGMAKAFEIWAEEKEDNKTQIKKWDTQICQFIKENIPNVKFHEEDQERVAGIINVAFEGLRGGALMTELSEKEGIAIATGSACTSDIMSPTDVIKYIEPDNTWQYPIRISLHKYLKNADIEEFCEVLQHYVQELRRGELLITQHII